MQKIDYLENKVNKLLNELNYVSNKYSEFSEILKNLETKNYLLNPNFSINQKGLSSYTSTTSIRIETVDKWYIKSACEYYLSKKLILGAGAEFVQIIDDDMLVNLLGKDVTLSFYFSSITKDNDFTICARVWTDSVNYTTFSSVVENTGVNSLTFNISSNAVKVECFVKNNYTSMVTVVLDWAKLEKGLTFTNYTDPFKQIETLKCNKEKISFCEVIYDNTSSDENINWGYTSGIKGGITVANKDFTKYKSLRFHIVFGGDVFFVGELPLTNPKPEQTRTSYTICFKTGDENASQNFYYDLIKINNKSTIVNSAMGYYAGSSKTSRNNHENYYINKIEGVF